jgi:hypothetical protein
LGILRSGIDFTCPFFAAFEARNDASFWAGEARQAVYDDFLEKL